MIGDEHGAPAADRRGLWSAAGHARGASAKMRNRRSQTNRSGATSGDERAFAFVEPIENISPDEAKSVLLFGNPEPAMAGRLEQDGLRRARGVSQHRSRNG